MVGKIRNFERLCFKSWILKDLELLARTSEEGSEFHTFTMRQVKKLCLIFNLDIGTRRRKG